MEGFLQRKVFLNGRIDQGLVCFADDVLISEIMTSLNKYIDLVNEKDFASAQGKAREIIGRQLLPLLMSSQVMYQ